MNPLERFHGPNGQAAFLTALRDQFVVHGDVELATKLLAAAKLSAFSVGDQIIKQGDADSTVHFLLFGEVAIVINGREMARRKAGQQVGEMALIDVGAARSASVIARQPVVTAEIDETSFTKIANQFPFVWRRMAAELGARLRQRTAFIRAKNETPILFIGSSKESLPLVDEIVAGLKSAPFIVQPWNLGTFYAGRFPIEDLARQVERSDFAALLLGPDDQVVSRGSAYDAPRDNVLLELGLFMGALGRERSFMIVPSGANIKIPTDLLGLSSIRFSSTGVPKNDMTTVCEELNALIVTNGSR